MDRMIGSPLDIEPKSEEHAEHVARLNDDRVALMSPGFIEGPEHVLVGGRATGKTFHAMRWLLEESGTDEPLPRRVLVVQNTSLAAMLRERYGLKANDDRIVSWRQLRGVPKDRDTEYGFDGADEILTQLFGLRGAPHLMTVTSAS